MVAVGLTLTFSTQGLTKILTKIFLKNIEGFATSKNLRTLNQESSKHLLSSWEKVRKIAGRIRIFVQPQEECRTPRKILTTKLT